MKIEVLDQAEALLPLRTAWNESAGKRGNLYLTYEWVLSLWESHFGGTGAEFLILRQGSRLSVVPLVAETVRKHWMRFRQWGLVTNKYGRNHNDLLLADGTESLGALLSHLRDRGCDIFYLGSLADDSDTGSLLERAAPAAGFRIVTEPYVRSPYLALDGNWDTFLAGKSANFRSDLKRKWNKAVKAGVEIRMFTRPDEVDTVRNAIYEIETRSWKEESQTSITTNPLAMKFYERFLPRAAEAGWFHSYLLSFDGKPAAYDMGILFRDRYYMLKTSYDHAKSDLSPGVVLRQHVIRSLYEKGAREHDFLGDDEPWKMRWTSTVRAHRNFYLYDRRRPVPGIYSYLRERLGGTRSG